MTSWGTYTKADLNAALTDYTSELHTLGLALPTIWPRSIEPLGAGATTGWIKTIVSQREHGYISPMAAGRDLRFHSDSVVGLIFQQLRVGTFVRYDESENLAINVQRGPGPRECLEDALNAIGNPALFNQESAELIAAWLVKVAEILEDSQEDGDYEKISQLCNAAFRVYKSLGDRNQYIRERRSTIQMFYWAYLGSFMASQRDDFEVCMQSFSDIVTRAFDNDRAGLLNARRGTEDTLIFFLDRRRRAVEDDAEKLRALLIRYFPVMWNCKGTDAVRIRQIKVTWETEAKSRCPETAESTMRGQTLGTAQLLQKVLSEFPGANHSEICSGLAPLAASAREKLSAPKDIFRLRAPTKVLRSNLRALAPRCNLVFTQIRNNNLSPALETLRNLLDRDGTNAALWEWSAYARVQLRQSVEVYRQALREFALSRTFVREDDALKWNIACCQYHLGQKDSALESLMTMLQEDDVVVKAKQSLALELKRNEYLVSTLDESVDIDLVLLGYVLAYESKAKESDHYLGYLRTWVEALQDSFQPPPLSEDLGPADCEKAVTYFLRYDLKRQGIGYFRSRLQRSGENFYMFHRSLAQLYEADGKPEKAWSEFEIEWALTERSAIPVERKSERLRELLDICQRHALRDEGLALLRNNATFVNDDEYASYSDELGGEQSRSSLVPPLAVAVVPDVSSAVEATEARPEAFSIGADADVTTAKNQIAQLNLKFGRLSTVFQLAERLDDVEQYCRSIKDVYGSEGEKVASQVLAMCNYLRDFVERTEIAEKMKALDAVQVLMSQLPEMVSALPAEESSTLTLLPRLRAVVADAERLVGRVKDPLVTILTDVLPNDEAPSSIVVEATNASDNLIEDMRLDLDTERGVAQALQPKMKLDRLRPKEKKTIRLRVQKTGIGDNEAFSVLTSFRCDGTDFPPKKPVRRVIPFRSIGALPGGHYVVDLAVPSDRPENFHGRDSEIKNCADAIRLQAAGLQGATFLDGIRRVGKSSLINFVLPRLPVEITPVRIDMTLTPTDNAGLFFRNLVTAAARVMGQDPAMIEAFASERFAISPTEAFISCIESLAKSYPQCRLLFSIDEFQKIIESIMRQERGHGPGLDDRVLDVFQGLLDNRRLLFLLSGSIRYQHLNKLRRHAFFGRVGQVPVSFVSFAATKSILQAPVVVDGVYFADSAISRVWELTSGYAWIIQKIGAECVRTLGEDRRRIVVEQDIDDIAEQLLDRQEIFRWWWDDEYLNDQDAEIIRKFVELPAGVSPRLSREMLRQEFSRTFGSELGLILQNLCDQQVLRYDVTDDTYEIKGELLARWLPRMLEQREAPDGYCALAIDHENLLVTLEKRIQKGRDSKTQLSVDVLERAIRALHEDAQHAGELTLRIAVANWDRFLAHQPIYARVNRDWDFPRPRFPEKKDAADDELRRAIVAKIENELLRLPRQTYGSLLLVSGDHLFVDLVVTLKKKGFRVLVRGWKGGTADVLKDVAGSDFKYLDDIIRL